MRKSKTKQSIWPRIKLNQVLDLLKDGTHGSHLECPGGKLLLSAKDIFGGTVNHDDNSRRISLADFNAIHAKYHIQNNDIALTIVGTIGRCALISNYNDEYTFQRSVAILRPNTSICPQFLYATVLSAPFQKELNKRQSISAQPGVYLTDLSSISFLLPPLDEQEKIAGILSCWDVAIEQTQDIINEKKELKRGLMHQLLMKQVRFARFTNRWQNKKLGDIGKFYSGFAFPDKEQGGTVGIPFFKVSDMNIISNANVMKTSKNYVSAEQIKRLKYNPIKKPAIIFAKVGAAVFLERKRIAKNFLIDNNMMAFVPNENIFYTKLLFDTIRLSRYVQVGALPSYNAHDLITIKISLPPAEEQNAIVDILSKADEEIDLLNQKLDALKQQKKGLMQKLLTGEIRVKIDKKDE